MQSKEIEIRFPRLSSAITGLLFSGVALFFLDAALLRNINIDMGPNWLWVFFCISGLAALMTLKNAVSPNLIFAANRNGLRIGRGVLFNKIREIHWGVLKGIEEGTMITTIRRQNGPNVHREIPAVRLVFDESIDLGRLGYEQARPDQKNNFLIAAKLFRRPLTDTLTTLKAMKNNS